MAAYTEAWLKFVNKYLENTNDVFSVVQNDSALANNSKVWIPTIGTLGTPTKGRTPAVDAESAAVIATESAASYDLSTFHSPYGIVDKQTAIQLSFNKLPAFVEQTTMELKDYVADWLIYNWYAEANSGNTIETTGTGRTSKASFQTGNRKKLTFEDVQKLAEKLDYDRVQGERYLLLDSYLYGDLVLDARFEKSDKMAESVVLKGFVGEIAGFKVIKRAGLPVFSGTTILDPSQTPGSNSLLTGLAFTSNSLRYAMTDLYMYFNPEMARSAGAEYRMGVNAGSSLTRKADKKGVIIIKEATA